MEKKRLLVRMLSLMLCLMVTVGMCFAFSGSVYAAGEETAPPTPLAANAEPVPIGNGASAAIVEHADIASAVTYVTPEVTKYSTYSYNVSVPQKGTLVIEYAVTDANANLYVNAQGSGASYAGTAPFSSSEGKMYYMPSAGNVSVSFSYSAGKVFFSAWYVSDGRKIPANGTEVLLGASAYDSVSSCKVTVPSNGYITVTAANIQDAYSVRMKATGFKDWEYLSSSNGFTANVGVKKGTYTISFKGAAVYSVKTTFHKVKETSAKSTKKKAASIKKGKLNKGIIPANSRKKVHWYKIKNPKNQKIKLAVNAKKISGGGAYGKLKITVYFPDKKSQSANLYAGNSNEYSVTYGTIGTKKARKGTYYIKIVSSDGANGYYTLKWK